MDLIAIQIQKETRSTTLWLQLVETAIHLSEMSITSASPATIVVRPFLTFGGFHTVSI